MFCWVTQRNIKFVGGNGGVFGGDATITYRTSRRTAEYESAFVVMTCLVLLLYRIDIKRTTTIKHLKTLRRQKGLMQETIHQHSLCIEPVILVGVASMKVYESRSRLMLMLVSQITSDTPLPAYKGNEHTSIVNAELPGAVFTPFARLSRPMRSLAFGHSVFIAFPRTAVEYKGPKEDVRGIRGCTAGVWGRRMFSESRCIPVRVACEYTNTMGEDWIRDEP